LVSSKYIAGDRCSTVNVIVLITIDFNQVNNIRIAEEQKNLTCGYANVCLRSSAKA
ncbi:MAG: hypothetical protein ACJAXH_002360, partial [Colwellia sp.]